MNKSYALFLSSMLGLFSLTAEARIYKELQYVCEFTGTEQTSATEPAKMGSFEVVINRRFAVDAVGQPEYRGYLSREEQKRLESNNAYAFGETLEERLWIESMPDTLGVAFSRKEIQFPAHQHLCAKDGSGCTEASGILSFNASGLRTILKELGADEANIFPIERSSQPTGLAVDFGYEKYQPNGVGSGFKSANKAEQFSDPVVTTQIHWPTELTDISYHVSYRCVGPYEVKNQKGQNEQSRPLVKPEVLPDISPDAVP